MNYLTPYDQWGQRDSNPRPPAPRAYTQNNGWYPAKLDDSPSLIKNKPLIFKLK